MKNTKRKIKGHLDLFSGIGGFSLGLERAGVEPKWIGYSDIDKNCNQVFNCLKNRALIRELHVYGRTNSVGYKDNTTTQAQNIGI